MKINKLKILSITTYCLFSALWSEAQCMEDNIEFSYELSQYSVKKWKKSFSTPFKSYPPLSGVDFPILSDNNLLPFNVIRITTEKINVGEELTDRGTIKTQEDYKEVSTGFLTWSSYDKQTPIPAVHEYYQTKKEPLLVTCLHCVKEFPEDGESIKTFSLNLHYVSPKEKKFYLINIVIPNTHQKVEWIHESQGRDMAILRLGEILQKGKNYLDHKVHSNTYPFIHVIGKDDLYSKANLYPMKFSIGYLSDIVMFGYPYELSASNSLPLARFGHCSTNPKYSIWEDPNGGAPDFYTDMASISGSSGSPIWFYFRRIEAQLANKEVSIDAKLQYDEVIKEDEDRNEDEDKGKSNFIVSDTTIEISNAELDDDEVNIDEKIIYKFAGMLFGGPEKDDSIGHDIHLGQVLNAGNVIGAINKVNEF